MRIHRTAALTALLLCGAVASLTNPVLASAGAEPASFALKPLTYDPALSATKSYFILRAKAGDVIADKVRIVNTGASTGTAYLYPVDATTGQTSGAVYQSRQIRRSDVGAWVQLARTQVTLTPGASTVVPFTIRVPRPVRPGDHLGGIVAENASVQNPTGRGPLRIRIKHLTIIAVELQLPGPVASRVSLTGVRAGGEHGYQYLYLRLRNTGTIMLKPMLRLKVRTTAGANIATRALTLDTFLPQTTIDYPVLLPHRSLAPGHYSATVTISNGTSVPVGYRTARGAPFTIARTFPFTVSASQQKEMFSGVAPVTAPTTLKRQGSSSGPLQAWMIIAALITLPIAAGAFALGRWAVR